MMASTLRPLRALDYAAQSRRYLFEASHSTRRTITTNVPASQAHTRLASPLSTRRPSSPSLPPRLCAPLHTSLFRPRRAHNQEEIPEGPPTTDFNRMDMLGQSPAPSTSVDICSSDGFKLNSGVSIYDGKGVLLVGGEAFEWQPWGKNMKLINTKGQWEVEEGAFGLLDLLWPKPDLLILGLGPEMRPLSPATRRYLTSLGLRIEILDTRNAASQFNMLATERGVDDVAAALIPIGWREGIGARYD
ncbi:hypothetical protein M406DRAFT_354367 [Cryphonectria parasitica EP155]|uniref:NADH dehydrogenase [ubiquinone] 1 alpha subcomplex assembly factor 3 n=1 Tax=Cryphonectria parasitica (strain ATCC 38755 / EP155) TaxID=660469 RepID=A0A9P4YC07_CRYP1|nr:uncharacterized protein M406DRAFT_354367 [Cryphonectria parasitica EP155]KAF3770288.1 hypothetical protein M406DRAFT_354367 [Cryphonectria parasitica EP155]